MLLVGHAGHLMHHRREIGAAVAIATSLFVAIFAVLFAGNGRMGGDD